MAELGQKLMWLVEVAQFNMHYILSIIAVLWIIQIMNVLVRYRLNVFGLLPRHPIGLIGIFTSPFLHGSFTHLLFNCIPLFLLMNLLLLAGLEQFIIVSFLIIVVSGLCVWLVGRPALHVGASGLIMGYWGYLMINAILYPSIITVLFASLLPKEGTSWEGHIFGFLSGLLVSYINLPAYFSSYF